MGLYKTSIFSIFTFIKDNDLKFCTRSYNSCIYRMMRFKGSNGKVCKMMTSHFRTLLHNSLYYTRCYNIQVDLFIYLTETLPIHNDDDHT